ncbi:FAD-binding dehydrogenase [Homoserinibacter sp. YIM 151385]|uniref:FAD-binding dehydrogenase n=1 Tax=Homoserinibacter sp. YIM 151385 TaxID=2985506 RepID=UPI0022EFE176|nr:FAD-binding dehydrogenase [Homoserinibacter sp. YIM 151385]WBU39041.1 FAD-binding dehydrogenase [Homoserinibacter sp. YIM 151385]
MPDQADAIVIGAGLAGLVAAAELLDAGRRVVILEQEPEASLGGQAWWSFGGLFLVDSPEQRRMGVRDSLELARQDWMGSADFDRPEDEWGRRWAEAYLEFAAGPKRAWLHELGVRFFPVVGWAERGGYTASEHGNSVPRFHITWGTGPGILEPFIARVRRGVEEGRAELRFRHRVDELTLRGGAVVGASGAVLAEDAAERGQASSRDAVGAFAIEAPAVIVASGGIGGNHELVRAAWPAWLGTPPERMLSGVPAHVDGRMLAISESAGARLVNGDRMWHYVEGIGNHSPVWPAHGIRILPGPSSLWLDATGRRLPVPLFPGADTLGTLEHLRRTGHDHSWFVLTQSIIEKEFALSGSEQNPDLTGRSIRELLRQRLGKGATEPVERFKSEGEDFVVASSLDELLERMTDLEPDAPFDAASARAEIEARDRQLENPFQKDAQLSLVRGARRYLGDRLIRVASPHRLLDPAHGPLIAVRLRVLTRKSLGGIQTDLESRVLDADGMPVPGLFAAGEAAGFGGGGVHGSRSLEGTFLGGCLFSGRAAGRAAAG